ncbi:MAG: protein kinase, partial [Myxococcota bacterium]
MSARLRACAGRLLVVVEAVAAESGPGATLSADGLLAALDLSGPRHSVVARCAAGPTDATLLRLVADGLGGAAIAPATGVITLRSLEAFIRRSAPAVAIAASDDDDTFLCPPALLGVWDERWSRAVHTPWPGADGAAAAHPHGADESTAGADDPDAERSADELIGTVLPGRFRVVAELARGGFGTVYRGHQIALGRDVAIKVLHRDVAPSSDDWRLFVREIRTIGRLDHRNIVRIFQADLSPDGRLFMAMEMLAGEPLDAVVEREGPLSETRAVALMVQIVDGLAAAHDAGVVHCDIKPANIILVPGRGGAADGGDAIPGSSGLPLIIHSRDADEDMARILSEEYHD